MKHLFYHKLIQQGLTLFMGVLMSIGGSLIQQARAQTKHYLVSVAKSSDSWIRNSGETFWVPNEITTTYINLNTNLDVKVTTHPIWADLSQESRGKLKVVIKKTNTGTAMRRGSVTVKGRDGWVCNFYIAQYSDNAQEVFISKKECKVCADALSEDIKIQSNKPFTVVTPSWLTMTQGKDDIYTFSAKRLYGQKEITGNIEIKDLTGATIKTIPATNSSLDANWVKKPVFAVISDVHFGDKSNQGWNNRMPRVLKTLSSYPELKNIFVVGDISNNITSNYTDGKYHSEEEYKNVLKYFHDPNLLRQDIRVIIMRGNHDHYNGSTGVNLFTQLIDPVDNHYEIIDGYPFITMGADNSTYDGYGLDQETLDWLQEKLKDASRDYPDKPIFVFQHLLPHYTIIGSYPDDYDAYCAELDEIFSQYPQVIDFSGHTHMGLMDPHQIYQKNYTAVNDGSCKMDSHPTLFPGYNQLNAKNEVDYNNLTECLICHINNNDEVVMERWNTARNDRYDEEWIVSPPFNTSDNFRYTPDRTGGKNPWWPSGAQVSFTNVTKSGCYAQFPHAIDDKEGVNRYIIQIYANNTKIKDYNQSSLMYMCHERPEQMTIPISGLSSGTVVKVNVYARDFYELQSPVLSGSITLP